MKKQRKKNANDTEKEETYCGICGESYEEINGKPSEDWIMCNRCQNWSHEACTAYEGKGTFTCDGWSSGSSTSISFRTFLQSTLAHVEHIWVQGRPQRRHSHARSQPFLQPQRTIFIMRSGAGGREDVSGTSLSPSLLHPHSVGFCYQKSIEDEVLTHKPEIAHRHLKMILIKLILNIEHSCREKD
ncbi:hypothetical protein NQ318_022944 [Aromia moschata]|uniref:Uncharacterized protein n=1 Tax=Aromia moschata TaxID=1265417 RepID=A0AAV8XHJ4_9CUCU|nr:hypothetical protein NQ318_022944 [Aromia moschata]